MKKLIMFSMVIAIAASAVAEDYNVPDFAGGDQTAFVKYEFDVEPPEPTCGSYIPPLAPEFFRGAGPYFGTWNEQAGTMEPMFRLYGSIPEGVGENITYQLQVTTVGDGVTGMNFVLAIPNFASAPEEAVQYWESGFNEGWTNVDLENGEWVHWRTVSREYTPDIVLFGLTTEGSGTVTECVVDVVIHDGEDPPTGPGRSSCLTLLRDPINPIVVDPNVPMTVYETGETEGDFAVSLKFPPVKQGDPCEGTPYEITVLIDPNGGNGGYGEGTDSDKDIVLLNGAGIDNQLVLTFNTSNWDVPQRVLFKAINDLDAEPPELIEITDVGVTITSTVAEPNLNGGLDSERNPWEAGDPKWSQTVAVPVLDDDQANILFTVTPPRVSNPKNPVTGPVQIWEQQYKQVVGQYVFYYDNWRKIGVTLQVEPSGGPVKLQAVIEGEIVGDNFPLTDPCLPYEEIDEPNGMTFTAANYNVSQPITILGNDDALLQAEEAEAEGDENYRVELIVSVIDDGGDSRYTGLEQIVEIDIEDNECGAFGMLEMDISNPYYVTDPNYAYDDPDCYVDIHDLVEVAKRFLDCTDPQDPTCFPE